MIATIATPLGGSQSNALPCAQQRLQFRSSAPGSLLLLSPAATAPIPNLPRLRGLTLQIQGLVIGTRGELALANHLVATIE